MAVFAEQIGRSIKILHESCARKIVGRWLLFRLPSGSGFEVSLVMGGEWGLIILRSLVGGVEDLISFGIHLELSLGFKGVEKGFAGCSRKN